MNDLNKVLAVDDDENTLYLIDNTLTADGYEVIKADNGYSAVSKATSEHPGLIILDLLLPRMDGLNVVKKLKSNPATKEIPLIITTGHSKREIVLELIKLGVKNFLAKPFDIEDLSKRVSELFPIRNPAKTLSNLKINYSTNENIQNVKLSGELTEDDRETVCDDIENHLTDTINKIIINILGLSSLSNEEIKILESIRDHFKSKNIKVKLTAGESKSLRVNLLMNSTLKDNVLSY